MPTSPVRELTLSDARADLSEQVRRAGDGDPVLITVNGRPAALLTVPTAVVRRPGNGVWALMNDNQRVDQLTDPFVHYADDDRTNQLIGAWGEPNGQHGILWRHMDHDAAVLAVPTGSWTGTGYYRFFYTLGPKRPIEPMDAWSSGTPGWTNDATAFHAAWRAAIHRGSEALGIS